MADTTHTIGSTGIVKKLVDLGDDTYADAVATYNGAGTNIADDVILAKATGSTDGMGKVAALGSGEIVYIRCDCSDRHYSAVDFLVNTTAKVDLYWYVARAVEDEVTATLGSLADTETAVINGLTYTGEATAADAAYASRKFNVSGDDTADAAALAALINADYSVVTAGTSVAGTDKLTITTDEGAHTIVAAAAADYPAGKYKLDATAATELASIVLAINHKDNATCASVAVGDTVTVGGITYTAAVAEDTDAHEFAQITSDDATGTSLAACVNADTATHGITAANSSGVVSFTRSTQDATVGLSSSDATTLATEAAGGVPGVIAAATGATGELSITPTWTETLTVTEAGARLTVTDIDCPGVLAESALAVVTLTPGTPAGTDGDMATVIQAVTGTAAGHFAVSQAATLAGLRLVDSDADVADNHLTAGTLYTVALNGYEYAYLGLYADATTPTIAVTATKRI